MKNKKNIVVPAIAIAVLLGTGIYGINNIYASENSPQDSVVDKLVAKFNLNKDDVQKVFDEDRQEREKEMEVKFNSMLDEAISKGDLTESKKTLILEKRVELKNALESRRDEVAKSSKEDRDEKMKSEKEALEKWASENQIDIKYLMGAMGHGGGHGGVDKPSNDAKNSD